MTDWPADSPRPNHDLRRPCDDDRLLTITDLCRLVPGRRGRGVSRATVYRWIFRGVRGRCLPSIRIGQQRYVRESDFRQFVERDRTDPRTDTREDPAPRARSVDAELRRRGLRS